MDTGKFVDNGVILDVSELFEKLETVVDGTKMVIDVHPDYYKDVISDKNIDVQYDSVSGFIVGGSKPLTVERNIVYLFHDNVTFVNGI